MRISLQWVGVPCNDVNLAFATLLNGGQMFLSSDEWRVRWIRTNIPILLGPVVYAPSGASPFRRIVIVHSYMYAAMSIQFSVIIPLIWKPVSAGIWGGRVGVVGSFVKVASAKSRIGEEQVL